jgi:hypothetical protein
MKITQGISLYSYLYLKLAKTPCFSCYHLCFFFYRKNRTGGQKLFCPETGEGAIIEGEVAQIMYSHVSKCKNDTC